MMPRRDDEDDDDDTVLRTIKGAARALGVSVSQIYRLARDGHLELVKIGPRGTRVTNVSIKRYVSRIERVVPQRK